MISHPISHEGYGEPMDVLFAALLKVGILMLIYWDICTEAVNLVYALDPKQSLGAWKGWSARMSRQGS